MRSRARDDAWRARGMACRCGRRRITRSGLPRCAVAAGIDGWAELTPLRRASSGQRARRRRTVRERQQPIAGAERGLPVAEPCGNERAARRIADAYDRTAERSPTRCAAAAPHAAACMMRVTLCASGALVVPGRRRRRRAVNGTVRHGARSMLNRQHQRESPGIVHRARLARLQRGRPRTPQRGERDDHAGEQGAADVPHRAQNI